MNTGIFQLYIDYLICSVGQTTATRLSAVMDNRISHDKITRTLSSRLLLSSDLWRYVKPIVHKIESSDAVIIIDDSIEEKPYTDENEIICWHYDHSKDRNVKGINFMTALYVSQDVSVPVAFQIIDKTVKYTDKDGKEKRKSSKTKNEYYRQMLWQCIRNNIVFKYVLSDIWFSSTENMNYIIKDLGKQFIMPLKGNRRIALSENDKQNGIFQSLDQVDLESGQTRIVYLEGVDVPLLLTKKVFTNEDGSQGTLYLVTNDLSLDGDTMTTIYKKRWKVEVYHESIKQNASLEKSPTRTKITQSNHLFASLCAFAKIETLKIATGLNHFALKSLIYLKALKSAFNELNDLRLSANIKPVYSSFCVT